MIKDLVNLCYQDNFIKEIFINNSINKSMDK